MAAPRIVIALGGNALGATPDEQKKQILDAVEALVGLIAEGYEIIISHGNGPQVGMIQLAFAESAERDPKMPFMPLPECTAMSQGYIGYHLQNGILRELNRRGMPWHVSAMVTQIEVDADDPAFCAPSKPIGMHYTEEQAKSLMLEHPEHIYAEDAGRGWRRLVASPKPKNIVEIDSIMNLLDNEFIVIACGGGGIPVIKKAPGVYEGVDAVIDKDFASARLAEQVGAEYLFILTAIDKVSLNFGKPGQVDLDYLSVADAERLIEAEEFAKGSMMPKVQAAVSFAKSKPGRRAVIAALDKAPLAIKGLAGTVISCEESVVGV